MQTAHPRWLTVERGRVLFGALMCAFGLFAMAGIVYQYFAAQRRTQFGLAEIVKVKTIASGSMARILSPFEITYQFSVENETITTSHNYDVEPQDPHSPLFMNQQNRRTTR